MIGHRTILLMCGLTLVTVVFAGCTDDETEEGEWSPAVGDSATDRYRDRATGDTWTVTQTHDAVETITVRGETYNAFRIKEANNHPMDGGNSFTWVSADTGHMLRMDLFGDGTFLDFDPPCDDELTLAVDESSDVLCRAYLDMGGEPYQTTFRSEQEVLGEETVTVPSGTFETLRVSSKTVLDFGDGDEFTVRSMDWIAPDVCGGLGVKGESDDSDGESKTYENLSFACPRQ